ncbi:MAG TPA: S-ribosylhomocysteine lyase [Bacillota bacterium]|nr:S-ribosylhomocysteine lyase [Bacillota bacterium]
MNQVESFELDHDQVVAPYVRKAKVIEVNPEFPGCVVSKFDVRFAQPNQETLTNGALHTLEHLFATFCREYTHELIDISPMGCRTGFYFIFAGNKEAAWVAALVCKVLNRVVAFEGIIPGVSRKECGNFREHDLENGRNWAKRFLSVPEAELTNIFRGHS